MRGGIDADAPLDYVEFRIFPTQNRYEAFIGGGNIVENLASGDLEKLLPHIPEVRDLYLKGSDNTYKLKLPKSLNGAAWFTKSTLARFLHIVDSPDLLNLMNAIEEEMSQLEEARKFHFSLYSQDHREQFGSREPDMCNSNGTSATVKSTVEIGSSDASKNELLRAMELRISALREELASAFNQAAGSICSHKDIVDLADISQQFGATEFRNNLRKLLNLNRSSQTADLKGVKKSPSTFDPKSDDINMAGGITKTSKPIHSTKPVKYGVSPAKAAQIERQSSTESEKSSLSSDEEDRTTSQERSRTLIRSASPRRSASPMRRIQIGRSGSRRPAALTIKSLNFIPPRERTFSYRDYNSSEEEEDTEKSHKKVETNVRRMSVQDAINLFESKQKDQIVGIQQGKSSTEISVTAKKSVLRRWSASMEDPSTQCLPESSVQITPNDNLMDGEISKNEKESAIASKETDVTSADLEKGESCPIDDVGEDTVEIQMADEGEKLTSSAEWSKQKEAELNQMLMKMMESKPVRYRNSAPPNSRSQVVPPKQRGGLYDHYKEKRDEKLRAENAGKKEAQSRQMQRIFEQRKAEMASTNVSGRDISINKPLKPKNYAQKTNIKNEKNAKPLVEKKAPSSTKTSPLPATRKSWPSTTSKTPIGINSSGTPPTRRKPQPSPSVTRSSPKVEKSQSSIQKTVKKTQTDASKNLRKLNEKKQETVTKSGKTTKSKAIMPMGGGDVSNMVPVKSPSFYSKVTKKSSVVPLESKPFLRKGSRTGPGVTLADEKTKVPPQMEEKFTGNCDETLFQAQDKDGQDEEVVVNNPHSLEESQNAVLESIIQVTNPDKVTFDEDVSSKTEVDSSPKTEEPEEPTIPPIAWVEIEEEKSEPPIPLDDFNAHQIQSTANLAPAVQLSNPRVRQSLSQMLLEETSEEPDITEWGNAENPPSMIYQKDAPKGLKRLLKFARKNKGDGNTSGWSSPSAFSEGEDDVDDFKAVSRGNNDNLLKKATLHGKSGQEKTLLHGGNERNLAGHQQAQSNISKFNANSSSQNLKAGHISNASNTTKATRSFFSLSAFRGSKPNEAKFR